MSLQNHHSSLRSILTTYDTGNHYTTGNISSFYRGNSSKFHQKNLRCHNLHHSGHYKAQSLHGGNKQLFSHFTVQHIGGGVHGGLRNKHHGSSRPAHGLLSINEKETMQFLNERLASYLEKVHSLEGENANLEKKICEWYAYNAPAALPDYSKYFRTIQELQNQVASATSGNAKIVLQIDNAQQAANDFRSKYELEKNLRNQVEADNVALHKALEQLKRELQDLAGDVQCLQQEIIQMKNNHAEKVDALRSQLGARVNVEMKVTPSIDLNRVLSAVRDEYEDLMQRNLKEVENMFLARSAELNREVFSRATELRSVNNELIDLRLAVQTLEIELERQINVISALKGSLAEVETAFGSKLSQLQCLIDNIEAQLAQIRSDLERQNQAYQRLVDQKTHLEMEISTYRHLMDGHNINVPAHNVLGASYSSNIQKHHTLHKGASK